MEIKKIKNVATHDGGFHSDEIFAIAILRLINPKLNIIRTKKTADFSKADIRIDVGREYNPSKGYFDHHQATFKLKRKNDIPYASAGLIWKHFGRELINSDESFYYIDSKIIQPIDSHDSGILPEFKGLMPLKIQDIIDSFMPNWDSRSQDLDGPFKQALEFAIEFLRREVNYANGLAKAREIIYKQINPGKEYIVLNRPGLPWEDMGLWDKGVLFVIYQHSDDRWVSKAVPKKKGTYIYTKLFPKGWADLTEAKLENVTGVKDALFCHKLRFIASASSKEGTIKLTELALREKD